MVRGRVILWVVGFVALAAAAAAQTTGARPGENPGPVITPTQPTIQLPPTARVNPRTPELRLQRQPIRTGELAFVASATPPPPRGATSTRVVRTGQLAFIASTTAPPARGATETRVIRTGELTFRGAP